MRKSLLPLLFLYQCATVQNPNAFNSWAQGMNRDVNNGNWNQPQQNQQKNCQTRPITDMYGEVVRYDTVCE